MGLGSQPHSSHEGLKQARCSLCACAEGSADLLSPFFVESFIQNFSALYSPLKRHLIGSDSAQFSSQRFITEVTTDSFWEVVLQKQVWIGEQGRNHATSPSENYLQSCHRRGAWLVCTRDGPHGSLIAEHAWMTWWFCDCRVSLSKHTIGNI